MSGSTEHSGDAPRPRRRRVLTGAALTAATLGGIAGGARLVSDRQVRGQLGRFGMTITDPAPGRMDAFREDLDTVQALGLSAVRFGAGTHELVSDWGVRDGRFTGEVALSDDGIEALARGIDEAEERGLRSCVMTIGVYPGDDVSEAVFAEVMADYWHRVSLRLAPRAPLWQVFNEPDGDHYRTLEPSRALEDPSYVEELAASLDLARRSIQAATPTAQVTTNLSGFPVDEALGERWTSLLDRLAPSLDVITVDAYPETDPARTRLLASLLDDLRERYGKPVEVGEIGMKTCPECFTLEEQSEAFSMYLDRLAGSAARTVYFYRLRDSDPQTGEGSFGILEQDGSDKPVVRVIRRAAREAD